MKLTALILLALSFALPASASWVPPVTDTPCEFMPELPTEVNAETTCV